MKTLIYVSKKGCVPCTKVSTVGQALEEDFGDSFVLNKLDYDENKDAVASLQVDKVPLFILTEDSGEISRIQSSNPETVYQWFSKNMMIF